MNEDVPDKDTAIDIAEDFANDESIGQFGEVTDVEETETEWQVEFQTSTFSETYTHRIRITKSVGNVIAHDRSSRFD